MNLMLEAILNGAILSAALTAMVWLALHVSARRSLNAATRYGVWWAALAVAVLLPLAWMPMPRWSAPATHAPAPASTFEPSPAAPAALQSPPAIETAGPIERPTPSVPVPAASPVFPVRVPAGAWTTWLLAALAAVSASMLLRLAASYALLARRRSRAAAAPAQLGERLRAWLSGCGSARSGIVLAVSPEIASPVAVGPRRPAILLPARLLDGIEEVELDQIGLHEAAHLARRDDIALLVQRTLEAVFAWHPVVRWIGRRLDLEREIACDDFVIAATGSPKPYAACLARMAELAGVQRAPIAAAAAHGAGDLSRRIEMLLDRTRHRGTRVLKLRMAGAIAAQIALAAALCQTPGLVAVAAPFAAPPQAPAPAPERAQAAATPVAVSPGPVQQWIAANAIRLKTAEARNGFADMQPLKKTIGNARIVSLGEATHGTREFFQLKHRMMEFLATEMGFTIFSIEANMPEAYRLNEYVLEGKGDPAQLLAGMYFWTWNTEEVLDMIRWMREFNQSGKGRVQFTGFDMQFPDVAIANVAGFVSKHDADYVEALGKASKLAGAARPARQQQARFGYATGRFLVNDAVGKQVRFSGWIRTENVTDGYAGLWWRVDGPDGKPAAFRNLREEAPTGTTGWKRYSLEIDVAKDASNINFGALLTGGGAAWFDGLTVELDGKPYTNDLFELDFEGPQVKGFFIGANPWSVALDRETVRYGSQSLRIRRDGPAPPKAEAASSDNTDAKSAAQAWKDVVSHMEASRDGYRSQKAANRDIDWAIQNARVVVQCMQGRSKEVARDRSMAANVKWILDQNPGAKIVLWAHNGHVAAGSYRGYEPMGADLRRIYGDQMVVFGFAFHQGSFQAVETGKGLRNFSVSPASPGTLDAAFASSGIPIFALDLRRAPTSGPVAEWLNRPGGTRTIGAVYAEANAGQYFAQLKPRESFDAMLFVEKTTAARKNASVPSAPSSTLSAAVLDSRPVGNATEYRDSLYGVAFSLPAAWPLQRAMRWGDRETTAWFIHPDWSPNPALYFRPSDTPGMDSAAAAQQRMREAFQDKVRQRLSTGHANYRIRASSCRERTVGGRHALSCIADFRHDEKDMSEYITYVVSDKFLAMFFGRAPAGQIGTAIAGFDPVIETLRLP